MDAFAFLIVGGFVVWFARKIGPKLNEHTFYEWFGSIREQLVRDNRWQTENAIRRYRKLDAYDIITEEGNKAFDEMNEYENAVADMQYESEELERLREQVKEYEESIAAHEKRIQEIADEEEWNKD